MVDDLEAALRAVLGQASAPPREDLGSWAGWAGVDLHAMGGQRLDQGGAGGRVAQQADAQAAHAQAAPEGRIHGAEMRRQARRAGQHQKETAQRRAPVDWR